MDPLDSPAPAETPEVKDDHGTVFRSGFHRINSDGSPFKGSRGQFMPRGGRIKGIPNKPKNEAPAAAPVTASGSQPGASADGGVTRSTAARPDFSDVARIVEAASPDRAEAKQAAVEVVHPISHDASAEAWLRGSYAVLDGVLSARGEWQPENTEHGGLKDTLVAWQRARQWAPLPPGGAFVMACLAFIGRRVRQPNTAKTLVKWFPGLAPVLGVEVPKTEAEITAEKTEAAKPEIVKSSAPVSARAESFFGG